MLESLEKLRELKCEGLPCTRARKITDAIQSEIDERYMALPLDADGVPIHVGDVLENNYVVDYVAPHWVLAAGRGVKHESSCHHVKPRTIEDVLKAFFHDAIDADTFCTVRLDDVLAKYADELRGMMGGDA